ncbi:GNAT family N-acetyltransferase [Candidatus Saccharibacteria bacterium]|nr:GNAT family N-acetyltransferase [candidate division Zixibacteria bacterium]NIT04123.1 GNAT family N-acetyltransferase [Candidatus Saccharibacteria bacterium]
MMGDVTVRPAGLQDLEWLCKTYCEFHEFHVRGVPDRLVTLSKSDPPEDSKLRASLKKIIEGDESVLFIAEVTRRPVGFAEVYVREDTPDPARVSYRYGYVQSLMVDEAFRRHSVGRRLMEAAERWTKEQGATEM